MSMKLIVTIVQNDDADDLIDSLTAAHFGATRLASTGGFLRQGSTTIIVGVPEESVDPVLKIIQQNSQRRKASSINPFPAPGVPNISILNNTSPETRPSAGQSAGGKTAGSSESPNIRANVFVLDLERYERI